METSQHFFYNILSNWSAKKLSALSTGVDGCVVCNHIRRQLPLLSSGVGDFPAELSSGCNQWQSLILKYHRPSYEILWIPNLNSDSVPGSIQFPDSKAQPLGNSRWKLQCSLLTSHVAVSSQAAGMLSSNCKARADSPACTEIPQNSTGLQQKKNPRWDWNQLNVWILYQI